MLLDFPIDVLFTPIDDFSRVAWGGVTALPPSVPGPDPRAIEDLASMIKQAERPVIIVGTGARNVS